MLKLRIQNSTNMANSLNSGCVHIDTSASPRVVRVKLVSFNRNPDSDSHSCLYERRLRLALRKLDYIAASKADVRRSIKLANFLGVV